MSETILLLLAALFAMAGVNKFRSQPAFRAVLRNFVPAPLVNVCAMIIPLSELILSLALLNSSTAHAALFVACGMLALFTGILVVMKILGIKGCACFGEQPGELTVASGMSRNILLILLTLVALGQPNAFLWQQNLSTFLGELTVVVGAICIWPCMVALVNRRRFLLNWRSQP